nr:PREDICTED: mitotic interactor and substrate of PLK1 isoform X2 [Anolis carolinensis]|eukprot:XP_016854533.1 PREDICTED: mitotic interactor and substrate of PLK1 isoform X2 [Anolis carolinensis]
MALSKSTQELGSDSPDLKEESLKHQAKVVKEEVSHKTREEEEDKEEEGDRGEGEREGREGDGEGDGKGGDGEGDEGEGEKKEKAAVHIMEPNVRNAVFTIFPTTGLQKKEQNGHWTIKQDEMGSDAKENEQIDFRDQDPKTDGRWTRRDVLGERSRQMEKSVNGQPDLWTPPQDRDSRLAVVKSGSLYDVRAYKAEKKPSRLYGEDDADELPYRIPPEELSPEKAQELEAERQEVIKSQTVWKSTTVAERQSTSPSYTAVFAVCFDSAPADPENVDTEQISFAAARQQFLALEKTSPNVLQQCGSPRRTQTMPGVGIIGSHEQRDLSTSRGHGQVSLGETRPGVKVVIIDERVSRKYTGRPPDPKDGVEAAEETPIEREIRLSQEREEELWKERGIPRTSSRDELIEIRTKPLLWSSSSTDGKEKPRVSFPVQREIEQEARREEDLQKEGRLPGTYSRGERQQLAQRRKVFEPCKTMISGASERPNRGERRVADQDVKRSSEARDNEPFLLASGMGSSRPTFPNSGDSGEGFVMQKAHVVSQMGSPRPTFLNSGDSGEGLVMQKAHVASQMDSPRPTSPNSVDPGEGLVMQKAHFAIPVRKLRFGTKVEEHGGAPKRHEVFTLKTWRPRTSALIDQEIRDALRRELELQEERRNAGLAATAEPRSPNPARTGFAGCTSPISSSSSSGRMSALASPDRLSSRKPSSESGFQTCLSPSMRRREDGKYAGIELSDEIDTEVVRSTKAICRRGVLAQRWEAGEIRNARSHDEDDDSDSRD